MLLCGLEHVTHTRGADTDKHLDEVRSRNGEKRYARFAGNRAGKQGFTGARRADHQHAVWNTSAEVLEFFRIAQKFDDFADFFLGFIAAGHVGKRYLVGFFIQHARLGFPHREHAARAALALRFFHEEYPDPDQQEHREP